MSGNGASTVCTIQMAGPEVNSAFKHLSRAFRFILNITSAYLHHMVFF